MALLLFFKKLKNVRVNETLIVKIEKDVNAIDTNRKGRKQWPLVFCSGIKPKKKQRNNTHQHINEKTMYKHLNERINYLTQEQMNEQTNTTQTHVWGKNKWTNEQMIIRLLQKKLIELPTLMIQMTSVILGFRLTEKSSWNKIFYLEKNNISSITYTFEIR